MQVKYKMDDNIEELVNKWDETVKSLASSEIIYFKRYYYLPDIHDTVEKILSTLQLFILSQCKVWEHYCYICYFKLKNSSFE